MVQSIFFYGKKMRSFTVNILLFIISFSTGETAECDRYKPLSDANRATSNDDRKYKCDSDLSPGWYRMTGEAGDHIPEKCVPKNHCGTHAPGWLNGQHPTVQEGVVTRQVCYHWHNSCCKWKNNIKIRNCGAYYVYHLSRPAGCQLRYCGERNAQLTQQLQAQFTCNGELTVFASYSQHIDKLFDSRISENISSDCILNPRTEVLAVKCVNHKRKPWIMASASNGLVTDTRWKCFGLPTELKPNGWSWKTPLFDDTDWAQAFTNFSNREESSQWGKILDISNEAFWISTADKHITRLYCRRRLSEVSLKRTTSNGIFQATLDDVDHALSSHPRSQYEVSDVMQCFKKCQDDSQCLSFNFQYTSVFPTNKCELNGVTKGQDPKNFVKRPGYTYYENAG